MVCFIFEIECLEATYLNIMSKELSKIKINIFNKKPIDIMSYATYFATSSKINC